MDEQVLDTVEVIAKLRNLRTLMPEAKEPLLYDFAEGFADRLNPEMVPLGFLTALDLFHYDLEKGVNGFTGKPMPRQLVGHPPMVLGLLRMVFMRKVAPAVLPEPFMAAVNAALAVLNEAAQAKNKVP